MSSENFVMQGISKKNYNVRVLSIISLHIDYHLQIHIWLFIYFIYKKLLREITYYSQKTRLTVDDKHSFASLTSWSYIAHNNYEIPET